MTRSPLPVHSHSPPCYHRDDSVYPALLLMAIESQENEKNTDTILEYHEILDDVLTAIRRRDWTSLRSLSLRPGGFGEDRRHAWPFLLHASREASPTKTVDDADPFTLRNRRPRRSSSSTGKEEPDEIETSNNVERSLSVDTHPDERQIKLDTDRSFVLYGVEDQQSVEVLQARLNSLITSVFRRHPQLNYFQGYHDIISVLYLTLPGEDHLLCAEKLSLHRVRDAMGKGLEPLLGLLHILKYLLRLVDAEYADLLERNAPLPYFALSNLLTLFSHDVPTLPLIQHVFDFLLCRPPIAILYLAASVILSYKDEAIRMEREDEEGMLHSLLSTLPKFIDGDESSNSPEPNCDAMLPEDLKNPMSVAGSINEYTPLDGGPEVCHSSEFETHDGVATDAELTNERTATEGTDDQIDGSISSFGPTSDLKQEMEESQNAHLRTGSVTPLQVDESRSVTVPGSSIASDLSSEDLRSSESATTRTPSRPVSPEHHVSSSDLASRTIVSLPALLGEADALFELYPPSYPALHVKDIMGPQSVVFTWSEDPNSLMSDADAEAVVAHPELVVRSYVDPDEIAVTKEQMEREESYAARRWRSFLRTRLRKKHLGVRLDKKTVLTGTVVALSVAVAIYSISAKGGGNGGVLGVSRSEKTVKKTAKAVAEILIGDSERLLNCFNNFI